MDSFGRFNSANDVAAGKENPLKHQPGQRFVLWCKLPDEPRCSRLGRSIAPNRLPHHQPVDHRYGRLRPLPSGPEGRFPPPQRRQHRVRLPRLQPVQGHKEFLLPRGVGILQQAVQGGEEVEQPGIGWYRKGICCHEIHNGQCVVLYTFLHDKKSPYSRPVVFRFGFVRKKE
jgi:hypothetical protein